MKRLIVALTLALAATLLAAAPASAAGNKKCDTNSPSFEVIICVRTNASRQTDGTGYRMSDIRVWATVDPSTLESCPSFTTVVVLRKPNGEGIDTRAGSACQFTDYSALFDFGNVKFPGDAYVTVTFQLYDNAGPDPDPGKVTLDAVS